MLGQIDWTNRVVDGAFRVIRQLGSGAMGQVWLAEQVDMGRQVVLKFMHPELVRPGSVAAERFKREARAIARLNHPNVVQVFVTGRTQENHHYLAMEFVDGETLRAVVERGPIPWTRALAIVEQVASALAQAHSMDMVHRDLKPDNIMLTSSFQPGVDAEHVKVLDFGIAKLLNDREDARTLTVRGAVCGTPAYMAPEQVSGQPVDGRTDLYALGVILYEMVTGLLPIDGRTPMDVMLKHTTAEVIPPTRRRPELSVPKHVDRLIMRCLEKDPDKRFGSAMEVAAAVREARLAPASAPARRAGGGRAWLLAALILLCIGAGGAFAYFGLVATSPPEAPPEPEPTAAVDNPERAPLAPTPAPEPKPEPTVTETPPEPKPKPTVAETPRKPEPKPPVAEAPPAPEPEPAPPPSPPPLHRVELELPDIEFPTGNTPSGGGWAASRPEPKGLPIPVPPADPSTPRAQLASPDCPQVRAPRDFASYAFDLPVFPGARAQNQFGMMSSWLTERPFAEVADFYERVLGAYEGLPVARHDGERQLAAIGLHHPETCFKNLAVLMDGQSVQIIVIGKQPAPAM